MNYSTIKALLVAGNSRKEIRAIAETGISELESNELCGLFTSITGVIAYFGSLLQEAIENEYVEPETTPVEYMHDLLGNFYSLGQHNGVYAVIYHG